MAYQTGALPGDHAATKIFVKAYGKGIQQLIDHMNVDPWQRALHMKMPEQIQAHHHSDPPDLATSVLWMM
eukprot:4873735-Pyramimonas_sp.AAC.1